MRQCLNKGRAKKYHGMCEAHYTVFKERAGRKPNSLEDAAAVMTPYDPNERGANPGRKSVSYHSSNLQLRRGLRYWSQHVEPVLERSMRNIRGVAGENDPSVRALEERLAASEDRIALLRTRMQNEGTASARYYSAMQRAEAENRALHERIAALEENAEPIEELRQNLRNRRIAYEAAMAARPTQEQMAATRQQLAELTVVHEAVVRERDALRMQLANAVAEVNEITQARAALDAQVGELTLELAEAQAEMDEVNADLFNNTDLEDMTADRDRLTAEVAALRGVSDQANAAAANVERMEDALTEVREELRAMTDEKNQSERQLAEMTAARDRFDAEAEELDVERERLVVELAERKSEIAAAGRRMAEARTLVERISDERDAARQEVSDLQNRMAEATGRLQDAAGREGQSADRLRRAQTRIEALQNHLVAVTEEREGALQAAEDKVAEIDVLQRESRRRESELRELGVGIERERRLQRELREANATLEDAKSTAEANLRGAQVEWNEQRSALRDQIGELNDTENATIADLREENVGLLSEIERLNLQPVPVPVQNEGDFAANLPLPNPDVYANEPDDDTEEETEDEEEDNGGGGFFAFLGLGGGAAAAPPAAAAAAPPVAPVAEGFNFDYAFRLNDLDFVRFIMSGHMGGKSTNSPAAMNRIKPFFQQVFTGAGPVSAGNIMSDLMGVYLVPMNTIVGAGFGAEKKAKKAWLTMSAYAAIILLAARNPDAVQFMESIAKMEADNANSKDVKGVLNGVFFERDFKKADFKHAGRMLFMIAAVLGESGDGRSSNLSDRILNRRIIHTNDDRTKDSAMADGVAAQTAPNFTEFRNHMSRAASNILLATQ